MAENDEKNENITKPVIEEKARNLLGSAVSSAFRRILDRIRLRNSNTEINTSRPTSINANTSNIPTLSANNRKPTVPSNLDPKVFVDFPNKERQAKPELSNKKATSTNRTTTATDTVKADNPNNKTENRKSDAFNPTITPGFNENTKRLIHDIRGILVSPTPTKEKDKPGSDNSNRP